MSLINTVTIRGTVNRSTCSKIFRLFISYVHEASPASLIRCVSVTKVWSVYQFPPLDHVQRKIFIYFVVKTSRFWRNSGLL